MVPEVSILIPSYNSAAWIAAAIESALSQSIPEKEIIIVDDGSTDDSLCIAQSYQSDQVSVHSQSNRGASSARNTALRMAHGKYIQYLDADDLLAPHKISRQIQHLKQAPDDVVATCTWARFEQCPEKGIIPDHENFRDLEPIEFLQLNWEQDIMMHPAAWLIPRIVIDRAGPWDESLTLNDDGEYFCRIALASSQILYTADAMTYYRSNLTSSLSGRTDADSLHSLHRSIEKMESYLLEHDTSARTQHACAVARQRLAYTIFRQHPGLAKQSEQRARELSHGSLPDPGGRFTTHCAKFTGWRTALKIQSLYAHFLKGLKT